MRHTIFNTPVIKSIMRGLSLVLLRLLGWERTGVLPDVPRCVIIVAPHTCALDLFFGVLLAFALKLDPRFMAKKELFSGVLSPLMKWLGGIPVDRSVSGDVVRHMILEFASREAWVLAITPEGTRRNTPYWKSGFYHIAYGARVPIVPGYLDYATKRGGLGPAFHPTGNIDRDMRRIMEFYSRVRGRHPENTGPVRVAKQRKAS